MRSKAVILGALALAVCAAAPPPEAKENGPAFDPVAFFEGPTHGEGQLHEIMKKRRRASVDSVGRMGEDGVLVLDQMVTIEGGKPKRRVWRLREAGPGRYTGTLTDAESPVEVQAIGRAIRIRYVMKGGLKAEQWLVALPGGRAVDNRMTVTRWGMKVATLRERIDKR